MVWRRAFIREHMLVYGEVHPNFIIPEQFRFSQTSPSNIPTPAHAPSDPINPSTSLPLHPSTASSIADTLSPVHTELPTRLYGHNRRLPESTPPPGVSDFLDHVDHHISDREIPIFFLGEPIEEFVHTKIVELPAAPLGSNYIRMTYAQAPRTPGEPPLSAILLAYGRRMFIAVKPLNVDNPVPNQLALYHESSHCIPLPYRFTHPIRQGRNSLGPTMFLGVSSGVLGQALVEAVEPSWNGFLDIERAEWQRPLLVRASAVRVHFAQRPHIRGFECLPGRFELRKEDQIPAGECLEKASAASAEWFGVFLTRDEARTTTVDEQLNSVHRELLSKRIGYRIKIRRGMLFMWSMNIGDENEDLFHFVFAIVPDIGRIDMQSLALRAHRGTAL